MQIGNTTTQVARKQHDCWWCGEPIEPGETYSRWVWEDDGELLPTKVHPECREVWSKLPYEESEVEQGEFSRGCLCEHGNCRCEE